MKRGAVAVLGLAVAIAIARLVWSSSPAPDPVAALPATAPAPAPPHARAMPQTAAKPSAAAEPPEGLPTALPETPAVTAWLHEQGMPDEREKQDYLLGLNTYVDSCMAGTVARGEIRFWIHWSVDGEHQGRGSYEPDTSSEPTGFDDAARDRFENCVSGYVTSHEVTLPSYGGPGRNDVHWATLISFPIAEQEIYRLIAPQAGMIQRPEPGAAAPAPAANQTP
jgi:hypothetical protein